MRAMVAGAALAAALASTPARAQSPDVAAQIKIIETQPADMDRSTWKDKRREAARKLGQSKDKRAVAVLSKLAESETFDIIGEIAIEGLGNLGDPAAVPVLQKIAGDPARDKAQRELARKALGKIGEAPARPTGPTSSAGTPGPTATTTTAGPTTTAGTSSARSPTGTTGPAAATGNPGASRATGTPEDAGSPDGGAGRTARAPSSDAGALLGSSKPEGPPALPIVPDDALAAYERVTFAAGTANFGYDTARKRVDFDADVTGLYQKRIERDTLAWGVNAAAHVVAGYINPDGPGISRGAQVDASVDAEARLYRGVVYGIGRAVAASQFFYVSDVDANNPGNSLKDTRFTGDFQVAVGGGYGRMLDVGAAIRVRRLARTLDAARALGKPINAAIARQLQLTWWSLRGERSTYRALVATVAILREAGILLGEPDAGLAYEILNVLRDSQLFLRPSGLDAQLVFSEGYLQRPDQPAASESGRVEQLLAQAAYGAQLDEDRLELSGGAQARLRLFAPDMQPSPWAIAVNARLRRFAYGEHGDPLGAVDLSGQIQLSDDDQMNSQLGQRISGQLGFTWWINAASGLRLAATVAEDRGTLFLGAELTATYGLLDGTFAR